MVRRQVLHENKRDIRIRRQSLEKLCECLEASRRRAYADCCLRARRGRESDLRVRGGPPFMSNLRMTLAISSTGRT
jgi:hypothetical protein